MRQFSVSINLECGSVEIVFDFKFNFTHAYDDIKTYLNLMSLTYNDLDPRTEPLDGEVIMRIGHDKQHGRYFVGNSILDPTEVPSLPQVKARSTSSAPPVQRRPTVAESLLETVTVIRCLYPLFNDHASYIFALYSNVGIKNCSPSLYKEKAEWQRD
jgi:hypothetical protein